MELFGKSFIRVIERLQEKGFTGSQGELIKDQNTKREQMSCKQIPLGPARARIKSMVLTRQVTYTRRAGILFHYHFLEGLKSLHFSS